MKRVGILGSGNVGANTAFFIAENRTAHVTLVDIRPGLATGKALDMMESGPIRGYGSRVTGADDISAVRGHDVVVLAAGRVRKPGEKRIDLYLENATVVTELCERIRELAPYAVVINVVEPVDSLTLHAQETLGFHRFKVLGVGGNLDGTRLRYLVSKAVGVSAREVSGLVIGPHRGNMLVLKDTIRVSGVPATFLLGEERVDALIEEVRRAGDTILEMAQHSTSYWAPSAATARLVHAVVVDTRSVMSVSVRLEGEYGVGGLCVSVPAVIGGDGVHRIVDAGLSDAEQTAFLAACAELRAAVAQEKARVTAR
ncbi:MAG: malate dehydrogenase [Kiritimatiellae bacterium]|nr:malate dehydrogenase [Kiritimatiellia bacterium]